MRRRARRLGCRVTGVQLGHAVVERLRGGEQPRDHLTGGTVESCAGHAARDDRGVVRPDATAVVAERPVAARGRGERAQPETGGDVGAGQQRGDLGLFVRVEDAGAEQMPGVGRQRVDGAAVAVERDRGVVTVVGCGARGARARRTPSRRALSALSRGRRRCARISRGARQLMRRADQPMRRASSAAAGAMAAARGAGSTSSPCQVTAIAATGHPAWSRTATPTERNPSVTSPSSVA